MIPFRNVYSLAAICLLLTGCWAFEDAPSDEDANEVEIANPEGDKNVAAAEGGPGFTGKDGDWKTAKVPERAKPESVKGGSIVADIPDWPQQLRIYGGGANTQFNYISQDLVYESLLQLDKHTFQWIPQLATHYEISEDQQTFTFRINPKAHWASVGDEPPQPVTADDVIATWDLLVNKGIDDPVYNEAYGKFDRPVKKSKYVVEVHSKERDWKNFNNFAGMQIIPATAIPRMEDDETKIDGKAFNKKYNGEFIPGSGPYWVVKSDVITDESITFTRRDTWWGKDESWAKGLYNFNKIRFMVADYRRGFEMAVKGDIDFKAIYTAKWWVEELNTESFQKGHMLKQRVFAKYPSGFQGQVFNIRIEPLNDVRVRKALAHLYDRRLMLKEFAYNQYTPLKTYFPNGPGENTETKAIEYDPEKAAELLAEAGWKERGSDGILVKDGKKLSLEVMYRSQVFEKYLTTYQSNAKVVGVELVLKKTDPTAHWDAVRNHKFEIAGMAWGASDFRDPKNTFHGEMADPKQTNNLAGLKNAEVDKLIDAYDAEFDPAKRVEMLKKMDRLIFNEHPYALDWYLACQRIIYKNKFGMPETVLPKYGEWEDVFVYWWVDPAKEKALKAAEESGDKIEPIPPVDVRPWDEDQKLSQVK